MHRLAVRRALHVPSMLRSARAPQHARPAPPTTRAVSTAPTIAQASFWKSLVPKPWRRENRPAPDPAAPDPAAPDPAAPKTGWLSKAWNPMSFYIGIFLLIGSMSIQMIVLRRTFDAHTRRSDVRIGLLREVVEKLQKGEQVDVEKVLGSGDPEKEAAWDKVLEDFEKGPAMRNPKKQGGSKTPEPAPSSSTTGAASTAEPAASGASAQGKSKAQTASFF